MSNQDGLLLSAPHRYWHFASLPSRIPPFLFPWEHATVPNPKFPDKPSSPKSAKRPIEIEKYRGTVSSPFSLGDHKRVAIKVIDDRGIESLKVVILA